MHRVRFQICSVIILSLMAVTARADVITSASKARAPAVAEQMREIGISQDTLAKMSAKDLDYFRAHPERVQTVGVQEAQNLWYESVVGGIFMVAMTALAIGIVVHNRDT